MQLQGTENREGPLSQAIRQPHRTCGDREGESQEFNHGQKWGEVHGVYAEALRGEPDRDQAEVSDGEVRLAGEKSHES